MNRYVLRIVVIFLFFLLVSCQSTSSVPEVDCSPLAEEPPLVGSVSPRFKLGDHGALTGEPAMVLGGSASLVGTNHDAATRYSQYLKSSVQSYQFTPGGSYDVTFSYRILEEDPDGFETVMFSASGAAENRWVDSLLLRGVAGSSGRASFTFDLHEYSDYELAWNVVSTGSIVIDDIEIRDGQGFLVASESFEIPTLRSAQAYLPPARVGQQYRCVVAVTGPGPRPVSVIRTEGRLPEGLVVDAEGTIAGLPEEEGSFSICLVFADADGAESKLFYQMEVVPADHVSSAVVTGEELANTNQVRYSYEPYTEAFRSPLKGMRPYAQSSKSHPWASLGRQYIEWDLIERNACDSVARIERITDELIGDLPAYNIKIIPRVYLHWPPEWDHWPEDLEAGDYHSKAFQDRLFSLIAKLGRAWNDDPRIAYIETGLIGQWGEQHDPGFGNFGFDEPMKPVGYEHEFAEAFEKAFPDKLLMHRYPRDFEDFNFGLYWDVFGAFDQGFWGNDTTGMTEELKKPQHIEKWKTSVRGGEIAPTFMGYPGWDDAYFHDLVNTYDERLITIIRDLHWNHLAVLEHVDGQDDESWEKASAIQNALGHTFTISRATLPALIWRGELPLSVSIGNTGSSPFYYEWPLEVSLLDPATRTPVWSCLWPDLDIRTWLPGESAVIEHTFKVPPISEGEYIVALAILDPSGMVPSARFANKNYFNGGYTPLGVTAVGIRPRNFILSGFDDIAGDRSLYYLPPDGR